MKFKLRILNLIKFVIICLLISSEVINCYSKISSTKMYRKIHKYKRTLHTSNSKFEMHAKGRDGEELLPPDDLGEFYKKYVRDRRPREWDVENDSNGISSPPLDSIGAIRDNPFNRDHEEYNFKDCDVGFNFKGIFQQDLRQQILNPLSNPNISFFVNPIINRFSDYIESSVAYGDFTATELKDTNGPLASFNCNYFPIDSESTYGVIAYKGDRFPCGDDVNQSLNMCLIFDQCGTIAISTDGDSVKCLSGISDLGDALLNAGDYIHNTSFGLSFRQRFPKYLFLGKINKEINEFDSIRVSHRGNVFFSIKGSLPDDLPYRIGSKLIKDIFDIDSPELKLSFSFGENEIENARLNISNDRRGFLKWITSLGLEFAIQATGKVTLKLDELTYGLLPDLTFDVKTLDSIITSGMGATGLPLGIYIYFRAQDTTNLPEIEQRFFNHFKAILNFAGYLQAESEFDNQAIYTIFEFSIDAMGIKFYGKNYEMKCLMTFNPFRTNCYFKKAVITFLLVAAAVGYKWVVKKVEEFVDYTGNKILEFAARAGRFIENSTQAIRSFGGRVAQGTREVARDVMDSTVAGLDYIAHDRSTRGLISAFVPGIIMKKRKFKKIR